MIKITLDQILDKVIPTLLLGLIYTAFNLYIQVQILEVKLAALTENYEDIVVQVNSQLQERKP